MANQVLLELESAAQIMLVRNVYFFVHSLRYVKVRINFDSKISTEYHYNHVKI